MDESMKERLVIKQMLQEAKYDLKQQLQNLHDT